MPKIFVLRHQLAEQQAKLRQHDKAGSENANSPPLSSDEEKFEPTQKVVVQEADAAGASTSTAASSSSVTVQQQPLLPVSDILQRPRPGLVIQPIPAPPSTSPSSSASTSVNGKAKKNTSKKA